MNDKLTAVSLFSGAGGMDIGVSQAGFDVISCIELDKYCCETLRENISRERSRTLVYESDISEFSPLHMLSDSGTAPGNVGLLFGGSPCQAFSQIGRRDSVFDERGLLLFQILRYVHDIQPHAVMVEQVKGLLSAKSLDGKRGGVFMQFIKGLERLGYFTEWRVLLAADYGVAQLRERLFIVAIKGRNSFNFPEPTHSKPSETANIFGLPSYVTAGSVINGLNPPVSRKDSAIVPDDSHYDVTPDRDRERIHGVPEGESLSAQANLPREQVGGLTRKDTTKFLRISRYRPSNTLRGGEIFYHPVEDRYLTPREYMRLHGYPDSYVLRGPVRGRTGTVRNIDQHRQVANSVPPPLARAVAEKIRDAL